MSEEASGSPEDQPTRPLLEGLDLRRLAIEGLGPGGQEDEEEESPLPEIVGYEILRPLGRGGMGQVFLARQLSLDRLVAVKRIGTGGPVASHFLDRLEREAKTMARLSHPNLVQVFDFVRFEEGNAALVMEWIPGGNLREQRLANGARIPAPEALALIAPILDGLEAAHRAGVVHRDIKPENIFLAADGTVKLGDFGLSVPGSEAERLTTTGTYLGTPGYVAPEQWEQGSPSPDERTDLYAIGVLLYEMLTGRVPVGNFDPPRKLAPATPSFVDEAVLACLRTDPAARPRSVDDLRQRLTGNTARHPRRALLRSTIGTAVAGALGAGAWLAWKRGEEPAEEPAPSADDGTSGIVLSPLAPLRILSGGWAGNAAGWESNGDIAILALDPGRSLVNTDIRFSATRIMGPYSFGIFFRLPQGMGSCSLSSWEGDWGGVEAVDGQDLRGLPDAFLLPVEDGRRYDIEVRFRPDHIATWVDGEQRSVQPIAGRSLSIVSPWNWESLETAGVNLALASYQSPTFFHSVEVRSA